MKRNSIAVSLALVAVSMFVGYQVYAHCGKCAEDGKKIATQLDQNKMTLGKMVTAAEEHSKGRAISAVSELNDKGQAAVHVFCIAGEPAKIMKCDVDYAGKVLTMKEVKEFPASAHHDHDEDHDHDDKDRGKEKPA
jgi:hypothetical protein